MMRIETLMNGISIPIKGLQRDLLLLPPRKDTVEGASYEPGRGSSPE